MSPTDRATNQFQTSYLPASHYDSPEHLLRDRTLSKDEKRVILSSWASDMYVVESHPGLREVPGMPHPLRLDDILTALKSLDDDNDPPPRGGLAMRLPRARTDPHADPGETAADRRKLSPRARPGVALAGYPARWGREAAIHRYRKLLRTKLTDLERSFVERRLAEEISLKTAPRPY